MENFNGKKEYTNLTPEQNKILQEVNDLLHFDKTREDSLDKFMARQHAAENFKRLLEGEGLEPLDYILWHRAIGSTPQDDISSFDTEDSRIEKFIRNFEREYEKGKEIVK